QADAVLAKIAGITWSAPAGIYKAKYLFPNATWGARSATAVGSTAPASFPTRTTATTTYGGNWTIRQFTVNFDLTTPRIDAAHFWDDYLEYIYGGYVEKTGPAGSPGVGERQPLVWLQNLFSHRMHQNFDVSFNENIFPRFADLEFPGTYKIVVYAQGFEDIVIEGASLLDYINDNAVIEQNDGGPFHVSPTDNTTWFENTPEGYQLHINGADSFDLASASLLKGTGASAVPVSTTKYELEQNGPEIALTFDESFFADAYQGAYTLRLVEDSSVASKPITFTVNRLVDWPTLSIEDGAQNVATANNAATPLSVPKDKTVSISNADAAQSLVMSGFGGAVVSSVFDVTANASVTTADVIKRDAAGEPYYLDPSTLIVGHTYRVTLATGNFSVLTGPSTYSTALPYYLTISEATTSGEGGTGGGGTGGGSTLPPTGDSSLPFVFAMLTLISAGSALMLVARLRTRRAARLTDNELTS
ncbi:MAG: hypothetical protein LBH56_02850, partial [Coriobacteriales bacterium]|nr:hypothetical protein [Coriobacteriales bacterium]